MLPYENLNKIQESITGWSMLASKSTGNRKEEYLEKSKNAQERFDSLSTMLLNQECRIQNTEQLRGKPYNFSTRTPLLAQEFYTYFHTDEQEQALKIGLKPAEMRWRKTIQENLNKIYYDRDRAMIRIEIL